MLVENSNPATEGPVASVEGATRSRWGWIVFHGLAVVAVLGVLGAHWLDMRGDARVELSGNRWLIFHSDRNQIVYRGPPPGYARHVFSYPRFGGACGAYILFWLVTAYVRHLRSKVRRELQERRAWSGLCPVCGYDLRASSERCPECGTPVGWSGDD